MYLPQGHILVECKFANSLNQFLLFSWDMWCSTEHSSSSVIRGVLSDYILFNTLQTISGLLLYPDLVTNFRTNVLADDLSQRWFVSKWGQDRKLILKTFGIVIVELLVLCSLFCYRAVKCYFVKNYIPLQRTINKKKLCKINKCLNADKWNTKEIICHCHPKQLKAT